MKLSILAIFAIAVTALAGCGGIANASPPAAAGTAALQTAHAQDAAGAYCKQTGGEVEHRYPVYGSNSSNLLFLAGERNFCQYTSKKDGSRIHILLETLYTTKPSLAALAYILKPASGSCNGNPASCYCSLLGGSDQFGGTSGAGGGWYEKNAIDQTLEACIFPDMSSIDSWGLTYHANGIIRGINLQKVMRYKYPG
jgi:putative hemolysin